MSELIKQGVFSAYYKWQRLDWFGRTIDWSGSTQPDTIKINHTADDGRENSAYIVPDQGVNGPEWALYYTIPGFKDNILSRFTLTNHVIFSTFAKMPSRQIKDNLGRTSEWRIPSGSWSNHISVWHCCDAKLWEGCMHWEPEGQCFSLAPDLEEAFRDGSSGLYLAAQTISSLRRK